MSRRPVDSLLFSCGSFSSQAIASWRAAISNWVSRVRLARRKSAKPDCRVPSRLRGASQFQIGLGNFEAVFLFGHDAQALGGDAARSAAINQQTAARRLAAADASAQLVQLRQAELFRVFNEHHRRVGNVDTDLDDGGGDENT